MVWQIQLNIQQIIMPFLECSFHWEAAAQPGTTFPSTPCIQAVPCDYSHQRNICGGTFRLRWLESGMSSLFSLLPSAKQIQRTPKLQRMEQPQDGKSLGNWIIPWRTVNHGHQCSTKQERNKPLLCQVVIWDFNGFFSKCYANEYIHVGKLLKGKLPN